MKASRGEIATFSSIIGIIQRLLQISTTIILMPLLLVHIGQEKFGLWAAATSLSWMVSVFDLGIGYALVNQVAYYNAHDKNAQIQQLLYSSLKKALKIGSYGGLVAILLIWHFVIPSTNKVFIIAAICLGLNVPASLSGAMWTGLQKIYVFWFWEGIQTILNLVGIFYLTHQANHDVSAYVLLTFVILLLCNYASLFFVYRYLKKKCAIFSTLNDPILTYHFPVFKSGIPFFLLSLFGSIALYSDNILALSLLGPIAASQVAILLRAGVSANTLLWSMTQSFWPAYTEAAVLGHTQWIRSSLLRGLGVIILCVGTGGFIIVHFGALLLGIWLHHSIVFSTTQLWALAFWIAIPAFGRMPEVLMNSVGIIWFQVAISCIYSTAALMLKIVGGLHFGVSGIIGATAVAYGLSCLPGYYWRIYLWFKKQAVS